MATAWVYHESSENLYSEGSQNVMGLLSRHNGSVRDHTSSIVNVGGKWSSLDLNIFPLATEKLLLPWFFHSIFFGNRKELRRCLCNVSAAVVAKIMLKWMMNSAAVIQKWGRPEYERKSGLAWHFFKFARLADCGVTACPAGLASSLTKTRNQTWVAVWKSVRGPDMSLSQTQDPQWL